MVVEVKPWGKVDSPHWLPDLDQKRDNLQHVQPAWGPIGQEVYERTYARKDDSGQRENWLETCYRVIKGNLSLVEDTHIEADEAASLLEGMYRFELMPAGRHIWVSGIPGRQFLFNCHRAGWTERFSRHSEFVFNELMKGGGVGANYSNDYINRYPALKNPVHVRCYIPPEYETEDIKILTARRLVELSPEGRPIYPPPQYIDGSSRVQDSREGWYSALNRLLESYFNGTQVFLQFDLGMLRSKGTIIKQFGGIASGPWALAKLLKDVSEYLNTCVGRKLTSLDWMMVDHLIAACVVAGNIRRSARMSIKHWADPDIFDFIRCKTDPNFHWSTNISVETDYDFWQAVTSDYPQGNTSMIMWSQANAVLHAVAQGMLVNGEPGLVNTALASLGERGDVRSSNPCGEIFLEEFENCNLGHVNLGAFAGRPMEETQGAFRLMQRYLIRATFGDITDPDQRAVVDRNRRTGVGIFGFQAWLNKEHVKFSECWDDNRAGFISAALESYKWVCGETAKEYAHELNIPVPIKTTTIAPTGTIAKLPGTTEGMQTIFARYFTRRVRYGASDPKVQKLFSEGYPVEKDLYSEDTAVVSFPVEDILVADVGEDIVEDASEVSMEDMMRVQKMLQHTYVDNAIAVTINVSPDKYSLKDILSLLKQYGPDLKGVTVMPEVSRPQMPYERITKEQFLATGVGKVGQGEMDCSTGACPIK